MGRATASAGFEAVLERFFGAQLASQPGESMAASLPALDDAIREGRGLLASAADDLTASQVKGLREGIAEAVERRSFVLFALGRFDEARTGYTEALALLEDLGDAGGVKGCREQLGTLERIAVRDLDQDVEQTEDELERTPAGSFAHCELLVRTAKIYMGVGDGLEARRRLDEALTELASLGIEPPTAQQQLEALAQALAAESPAIDSTAAATLRQTATQVNAALTLFAEIYTTLAFIERRKDAAEAARFAERAEDLLDRDVNWETAKKLLREALERTSDADQLYLPALLRPGGMQETIAEDLALEDGTLKDRLLEMDRKLEADLRALHEQSQAAQRRRDKVFEEHAAVAPVEIAAVGLRLALITVRRDIGGGARVAEELLPRATALEAEARRSEHPGLVSAALSGRSELLVDLGRDEEAIAILEEGVALLSRVEPHESVVHFLRSLAEIHARRRDWQAVAAYCERGIAIVETYRFRVTPPYLQLGYLGSRLTLYTLGARAAHELGETGAALALADLSKGRSVITYARMSQSRGPESDRTEREFTAISRKIDERRAAGASVSTLLAKRRPIWERLFIQRAHQTRGQGPGVVAAIQDTLPHLQARLAPDEAVLYYYWLDHETLLKAAFDDRRLHCETQILPAEVKSDLVAWASVTRAVPARDRRMAYVDAAEQAEVERDVALTTSARASLAPGLARLSASLLPDLDWLDEKQRIIVSPHRALHSIPFPALEWKGDWLLRRFATSNVPNLASLLLDHGPAMPRRVLALGSCTSSCGLAPRLDLAEREVTDIAARYRDAGVDCTVLAGEDATKRRWIEAMAGPGLASFSCLHFATHGSDVSEDAPMESRLFLRDAELDGVEISSWQLQAEVVVLSACWSSKRPRAARGLSEVPGDEVLGLQGAFFAAGARRILGALWPVYDDVAWEVMVGFHQQLTTNPDQLPEVALQHSLLAYLDSHPGRSDPLAWAPFTLSSLGRPPSRGR